LSTPNFEEGDEDFRSNNFEKGPRMLITILATIEKPVHNKAIDP
jgi:hypothetical protein